MSQKTVLIPGIGELLLAKRRGSRHIRLSILPDGRVRVGIPTWVPYSAAIRFAKDRSDWIIKHTKDHQRPILKNGDRIGKSYRLYFDRTPGVTSISARVSSNTVVVRASLAVSDPKVQQKAITASERALRAEARRLLPQRLSELAGRYGFTYQGVRIKKLTSRWGSCSSDRVITLNYFLMQLPWRLIDYVILHELLHTKYLNHGPPFWEAFEAINPQAKMMRKEINSYKPVLGPSELSVA